MDLIYLLSGLTAAVLFAYLIYALLWAEDL
jgi:K+-transporting ATPase KdpF subunit